MHASATIAATIVLPIPVPMPVIKNWLHEIYYCGV
jgi:hypothetical protein